MARKQITIVDFLLFIEVLRSAVKIVDSAKLVISESGLEIYGARAKMARCELTSNCILSNERIEFSLENLAMFNKILNTVKDVHENDFSELKFVYDAPFIRFESKKLKTK